MATSPRDLGAQAARNGWHVTRNPYGPNTAAHREWLHGYRSYRPVQPAPASFSTTSDDSFLTGMAVEAVVEAAVDVFSSVADSVSDSFSGGGGDFGGGGASGDW